MRYGRAMTEKHAVAQILDQVGVTAGLAKRDRERLLAGEVSDPRERCEILFGKAHDLLTAADYETLFGDPDRLVRTIAAYYAAVMLMDACPPSALPVLLEALDHLDELGPALDTFDRGTGLLLVMLARAVNNTTAKDDATSRRVLPTFAAQLDAFSANVAPVYAKAVFGLAFGNCEPPSTEGFLAMLERARPLAAKAELAPPLAKAFRDFGLPASANDLAALLDELRRTSAPAVALRAYMHGKR